MLVLIKSAFLGIALSALTAITTVGAAMAGSSVLLTAFVLFGFPSAYLVDLMLPSELLYSFIPDGGGAAFIGISVIGSVLQLSVTYTAAIQFFWCSRHAR